VAVWGWFRSLGRSIWDGIRGGVSSLWNGVRWLIHRVIGILELIGSLLGLRLRKKLRLRVVILQDDSKPLAPIPPQVLQDVEAVVEIAKKVFKDEANVKIIPSWEGAVMIVGEQAPSFVMKPKCVEGGFKQLFTRVGRWFRTHCDTTPGGSAFGYGSPATIFVVDDVQGKAGCWVPVVQDYGYIDAGALSGSTGERLTLAHELGHACDLWHRHNSTLMDKTPGPRTDRLSTWQISWLRSAPRVTYL
jgi:hypothetical protein